MIRNKKGFSLVELIVVVAILGILAAAFAPSLVKSLTDSQKDTDAAAVENLKTAVQTAMQNNSVYKDGKKLAEISDNNSITIKYTVDQDDILVFDTCSIKVDGSEISNENKTELEDLKNDILAYVNGVVEPIKLESRLYRARDHWIVLKFNPDVPFSVEAETQIVEPKEDKET